MLYWLFPGVELLTQSPNVSKLVTVVLEKWLDIQVIISLAKDYFGFTNKGFPTPRRWQIVVLVLLF